MERAKFRGKEKVHIQFLLTASAINLKKMVKILGIDTLKQSLLKTISGIIQFIKNNLEKRLFLPTISEALAIGPKLYSPLQSPIFENTSSSSYLT